MASRRCDVEQLLPNPGTTCWDLDPAFPLVIMHPADDADITNYMRLLGSCWCKL